jgi:hypothetical protein
MSGEFYELDITESIVIRYSGMKIIYQLSLLMKRSRAAGLILLSRWGQRMLIAVQYYPHEENADRHMAALHSGLPQENHFPRPGEVGRRDTVEVDTTREFRAIELNRVYPGRFPLVDKHRHLPPKDVIHPEPHHTGP